MNLSSECLEASQVDSLLQGNLTPEEHESAQNHLELCETCRTRVEATIGPEQWWSDVQSVLLNSRTGAFSQRNASSTDAEPNEPSTAKLLDLLGPTDDPNMLGRIGSYEIIGLLGQGGMGAVFKGFDRSLNRFVAIKMLLPHLAASGAARKRFAREGQAVAAVVDDHVMAIHCVDEWQGVPYLVMTYSRGVSLQKRLSDNGPLEVREILRIGMQAAKGLAAAHAQGIVHRDIKPANIFLDQNVERVQLMDFGLARAVDDASLTRSGTLAGTPQYMSPEQARAETVDHRSDLFSLGSVMYAMCTGHAPFRAESSYSVLRLITDKDPRPIREVNPDVPEWLCMLISRLMSKSLDDRYANALEVADLLGLCLAHVQQPAASPLPASLVPHAATVRRSVSNVTRAGVVTMLGTLGISLLGMIIWQATEPPDISGHWTSDEWGTVVLEAKEPGVYEGKFTGFGQDKRTQSNSSLGGVDPATLGLRINVPSMGPEPLGVDFSSSLGVSPKSEPDVFDLNIAVTDGKTPSKLYVRDGVLMAEFNADGRKEVQVLDPKFKDITGVTFRDVDTVDTTTDKADSKFDGKFEGMSGFAFRGLDKNSGTLHLKWSRLERRFNGTWGKGVTRSGKMSLRLVDNEIRGGWTTDEDVQLESGTPLLGDLLWKRNVVTVPDGGTVLLGGSQHPIDPNNFGENDLQAVSEDEIGQSTRFKTPGYDIGFKTTGLSRLPGKSLDRNDPLKEYLALGSTTDVGRQKLDANASDEIRLKTLLRAMYDFHDLFGHFPAPSNRRDKSEQSHSWRIALLPLLGHSDLYKQYRFDERWDSENNRKLLEKMPTVFDTKEDFNRDIGMTRFQMLVDGGAAFDDSRPTHLRDITDGTANTLAFAVSRLPVHWTKPADIQFVPNRSLAKLAPSRLVGMCDGRTEILPADLTEEQFTFMATRSGGEPWFDLQLFKGSRSDVEDAIRNTVTPLDVASDNQTKTSGNGHVVKSSVSTDQKHLQIHEATVVEANADSSQQSSASKDVEFSGMRLRLDPSQPAILTEDDIMTVESVTDPNNLQASQIVLTLTPEAGERFRIETTRLSSQPNPGYLVIEFDGKVLSAPRVNDKISSKVAISFAERDKLNLERVVSAIRESIGTRAKAIRKGPDARSVVEAYVAAALAGDRKTVQSLTGGNPQEPEQLAKMIDSLILNLTKLDSLATKKVYVNSPDCPSKGIALTETLKWKLLTNPSADRIDVRLRFELSKSDQRWSVTEIGIEAEELADESLKKFLEANPTAISVLPQGSTERAAGGNAKFLVLDCEEIDDLRRILGLTQLEEIYINQFVYPSTDFKILKELPQLRKLTFSKWSGLSSDEVAKITASLPGVEVVEEENQLDRKNARVVVEAYIALALSGDFAKAAALAKNGHATADPKRIAEIPDFLNVQRLKIQTVYVNDPANPKKALATSAAVKLEEEHKQPNGQRDGFMVLTLELMDDKWFVIDIDFESESGAEKELKRFLEANPKSIGLPLLTLIQLPNRAHPADPSVKAPTIEITLDRKNAKAVVEAYIAAINAADVEKAAALCKKTPSDQGLIAMIPDFIDVHRLTIAKVYVDDPANPKRALATS